VPAAPVKKVRNPKVVKEGLEAAFRKRQNLKLRSAREELLATITRVLTEQLESSDQLRTLYREASESLAALGLSLGASEAWADRLYIEDRNGILLFDEAELNRVEEAQARLEAMYTVDAWTGQLAGRLSSVQTLLSSSSCPPPSLNDSDGGAPRRAAILSAAGSSVEEILCRALKRLEEDMPYHATLFRDASSLRSLEAIEALGLPNELRSLGKQLVDGLVSLIPLIVTTLDTMATAAATQRIKAMRMAAATKLLGTVERARRAATLLRKEGDTAARAVTEALAELNRINESLAKHVPQTRTNGESDEEYY